MTSETFTNAARPTEFGPVALVPRINLHAFCETAGTEEAIRAALADRRLSRAHGTVQMGGIPAAVVHYQSTSTPNLLLVESSQPREAMLASLASLAEVCQPETKVMVLGGLNDVILYRELIRQGVSEYIVLPVGPLQLIESIAGLYRGEKAAPVGRIVAFMGAKGGVGSSTVAHNSAWELSRTGNAETALIDFDLAFGTAALHYNSDAAGGIMEALTQPERLDALLIDRLLVKLGDKLNLLGGPGGVDRDFVVERNPVEAILTTLRSTVPTVLVDVPNIWAPWVKYLLLQADHVVLTLEPELASLRNGRALVDLLKSARPNDPPPSVVVNKVGVPKRPEIALADLQKAMGTGITASIPFDPQSFGTALNSGKMILEAAPKVKAAAALRSFSRSLLAEKATPAARGAGSILKKLRMLRKS